MRQRGRGVQGPAKGTFEGSAVPKISVRFEPKVFERINSFAENSRCTFNEGVRLLIDYAFAQLDEEACGESEKASIQLAESPHCAIVPSSTKETIMTNFPKLTDLKAGDKLKADGGFTCLSAARIAEVKEDAGGLYVECTEGRHGLDGQEGKNGECVGLWRAP